MKGFILWQFIHQNLLNSQSFQVFLWKQISELSCSMIYNSVNTHWAGKMITSPYPHWPEIQGCGQVRGREWAEHGEMGGTVHSSEWWPDPCSRWRSHHYAGPWALNISRPSFLEDKEMRGSKRHVWVWPCATTAHNYTVAMLRIPRELWTLWNRISKSFSNLYLFIWHFILHSLLTD